MAVNEKSLMVEEVQKRLNAITSFSLNKEEADRSALIKYQQVTKTEGSHKSAKDTARTLVRVLNAAQNATNRGYIDSFNFLGKFYFNGIALIAVPFIMLAYFLAGEKIPFTLSNGIRLTYYGILLALVITSYAFPPAGLAISFVLAGVTFATSLLNVGRTAYSRYQITRQQRQNTRLLNEVSENMRAIQQEADALMADTNLVDDDSLHNMITKLFELEENFAIEKEYLASLAAKNILFKQQMNDLGGFHIFDRGMVVLFSTGTLVGAIVSLFFPVIGVSILSGVALVSAGYLVARFAYWLKTLFTEQSPGQQEYEKASDFSYSLMSKEMQVSSEPNPDYSQALENVVHHHAFFSQPHDKTRTPAEPKQPLPNSAP